MARKMAPEHRQLVEMATAEGYMESDADAAVRWALGKTELGGLWRRVTELESALFYARKDLKTKSQQLATCEGDLFRLREALVEMVIQHCPHDNANLEITHVYSQHLSANADAIRLLADLGLLVITNDPGGRGVEGRWPENTSR